MKHSTSQLTTANGAKRFTQAWLPDTNPSKIIIIVHGYADHSSRYAHVASYLVEQGYAVYAMDSEGHGQTSTDGYFTKFTGLVDDLAAFVKQVQSLHNGQPVYICAHSMGCMQTLYYLIRDQPPTSVVAGVTLSAPFLDADLKVSGPLRAVVLGVLAPLAPKLGLSAVSPSTVSRDPKIVESYSKDPLIYHGKVRANVAAEFVRAALYVKANLGKVKLPLFVFQGTGDRLVSPSCAPLVHSGIASADKQIMMYDGLYHEPYNEPEQATVIANVGAWLAKH
jgi:acylglycerol lipase